MTRFLLVHGASANGGYWREVVPLLRAEGHDAVAVDLPTEDEAATFDDYADAAIAQCEGAPVDVVVGQSMGAFTAAVVAARIAPTGIVLLCPMVPAPGETPDQWGAAVGLREAVEAYASSIGVASGFDPPVTMFHDVPAELQSRLWAEGEPPQAATIFDRPFPLDAWPDVPTRVIAGRLDRMFPYDLQRRVAVERLGVEVEPIPTGHLAAFARPDLVVGMLLR